MKKLGIGVPGREYASSSEYPLCLVIITLKSCDRGL